MNRRWMTLEKQYFDSTASKMLLTSRNYKSVLEMLLVSTKTVCDSLTDQLHTHKILLIAWNSEKK